MYRNRIIPCLQLLDGRLVKTVRFSRPAYIGDPLNTVRIFNELEADELMIVDIGATQKNASPNWPLLERIASECFCPLGYGGGVSNVETARRIFSLGFEKVILNTAALRQPSLITELANQFGSQAIVASLDVRKNIWGQPVCTTHGGRQKVSPKPLDAALALEKAGAGELLLSFIDHDGRWNGFPAELLESVCKAVHIPVVARGGAGSVQHIEQALRFGASAVALGSMVVYQKQGMGVLINLVSISQ